MENPAILIATLIITTLLAIIVRFDRRLARMKARGLASTDEQIASMQNSELRLIRDLLEPDIRSKPEAAQERFELIAQTLRDRPAESGLSSIPLDEH